MLFVRGLTSSMYRGDDEMIPFLVADRPISLSIIQGMALPSGALLAS
jgi:hypothetical protein